MRAKIEFSNQSGNYRYRLDPSSKKHYCPSCEHKRFVAYLDVRLGFPVDPTRYGRCDRENSCGYHFGPWMDPLRERPPYLPAVPLAPTIKVLPDKETIKKLTATANSPFHDYCRSLNIARDHLAYWHVYSDAERTVFGFMNAAKQFVNFKRVKYNDTGHRDKSTSAFYLTPSPGTKGKYELCLFGEHRLRTSLDSIVCVVESEKTAVIASYYYPQFDWVASGGSYGLTEEKMHALVGRKVVWLCDADNAGRSNNSIRRLQSKGIRFEVIDLFRDRSDGYDLADAIEENKFPCIKTTL
jgi:hypothetical protein